jgi:hypothetical protein
VVVVRFSPKKKSDRKTGEKRTGVEKRNQNNRNGIPGADGDIRLFMMPSSPLIQFSSHVGTEGIIIVNS